MVAFPFSISAVATTERRRDAGRRNRRPRAACGAASATPTSTVCLRCTRVSAIPTSIVWPRTTRASAIPTSIVWLRATRVCATPTSTVWRPSTNASAAPVDIASPHDAAVTKKQVSYSPPNAFSLVSYRPLAHAGVRGDQGLQDHLRYLNCSFCVCDSVTQRVDHSEARNGTFETPESCFCSRVITTTIVA